jgi:hypothetical protein
MRKMIFVISIFLMLLAILLIGCSSKNANPVPTMPSNKIDDVSAPIVQESTGHELLGLWTMTFDPETMTATIEPNRELLRHYNVKSLIPTPGIKINSFDPATWTIDVDVTLRNPYPISGYDVRLIIFTTDAGRTIINPDNWTQLYDIAGGNTINPFRAYAKSQPNRIFAGPISYTENLVINLAGNFNVQFAVDASYPSNCEEPYMIGDLVQEEPLYDQLNATATVHVTVSRWTQAQTGTKIRCDEVLGNGVELALNTDDFSYFYGDITNAMAAPAGEYQVIIKSQISKYTLYNIDTILVTEKQIYGWAMSFPDYNSTGGVETHDGDIYFGLKLPNKIITYSKEGTELSTRDFSSVDPFYALTDFSIHPDYDYIYSTGDFVYCETNDYFGMSVAKCSSGASGSISYVYDCFEDWAEPGNIAGDSLGNSYTVTDDISYPVMWKLNSRLETQWINDFQDDEGGMLFSDVAVTDLDTILGSGYFWGTRVDMDPHSGIQYFTPLGFIDGYISKWDSDGYSTWITRWGGYNNDTAEVYTNVIGSFGHEYNYVAGIYTGTVDFHPSSMHQDIHTHTGVDGDMYISKFDENGSYLKGVQMSGVGTAHPRGMTFDQYGNVYICGEFQYTTVDFDPGPGTAIRTTVEPNWTDIFVAKYTSDLDFVWVQTWGSQYFDYASDIAFDQTYNFLYVAGRTNGTLDFDPGEGVYEIIADWPDYDPFLMKLTPDDGLWE